MKNIHIRGLTVFLLAAIAVLTQINNSQSVVAQDTQLDKIAPYCALSEETIAFYQTTKNLKDDTTVSNSADIEQDTLLSAAMYMIGKKDFTKLPNNTVGDNPFIKNMGVGLDQECYNHNTAALGERCSCFAVHDTLKMAARLDGSFERPRTNLACKLILSAGGYAFTNNQDKLKNWESSERVALIGTGFEQSYAKYTSYEKLNTRWKECVSSTNKTSTEINEGGSDIEPQPKDEIDLPAIEQLTHQHPQFKDFQDMSQIFVPYVKEVLRGCADTTTGTTVPKQRCQEFETGTNRQKDRTRLAFLMSLVAHGSHGVASKDDVFYSNLGDSVDIFSCMVDPSLCSTSVYTAYKITCPTFSDISAFLPMIQYTNYKLGDNKNRYDIICQTANSPSDGVGKLLGYCQRKGLEDDSVRNCEIAIDMEISENSTNQPLTLDPGKTRGLLSAEKTQTFHFQTMYWNMVDIPPLKSQKAITVWDPISAGERNYMLDIINNPLAITPPKPFEVTETYGNFDFAGQCSSLDMGLGYFICGLTDGMIKMVSGMMNQIKGIITSQNTILSDSSTQAVWQSFLNISNVIFIIVFMMVIFSQLTGYGISDYHIKTILPKLIMAVILSNLSFFGVKLIMEISSIAGSSLFNMMAGDTGWSDLFSTGNIGKQVLEFLITLLMFLVVALVWVISLVAQVILLTVRAALIVIITVTAPLAVVLLVLPNTSRITKVWWRIMLTTALIHPILSILYGSGIMAYAAIGGGAGANLIEGTIFRSMIVLPMFVGPMIIWNLYKNMPMLELAAVKVGKQASQTLRQLTNPDPGSDRGKQKAERKKQIGDQVRTGNYMGYNPINKAKSAAFKRGLSQSKIFAPGTMDAMQRIDQARDERTNLVPAKVASAILQDISSKQSGDNKNKRTGYNSLSSQEQQIYNRLRSASTLLSGQSDKDTALDAALAFTKGSISGSGGVDGVQILKNFNTARQAGASQAELTNLYQQTMNLLQTNDQMPAIGELKANTNFNKNLVGIFDQALYDGVNDGGNSLSTTQQSAHIQLKDQRKSAIRSAFNDGIVNRQTTDKAKGKLILNTAMIPPNSLAAEALYDELQASPLMREAIETQSSAFSADLVDLLKTLDPSLKL